MKKITAILLLCTMILLSLTACSEVFSDDLAFWKNWDWPWSDSEEFVPVLRFAVVSDIHTRVISESYATQDEIDAANRRTERFFTSTYAYAQGESYTGVDAFIVAGDYTDDGTTEQYLSFLTITRANVKEESTLLTCLGNHEFRDTKENEATKNAVSSTYRRFSTFFGTDPDSVNVINGYYFIGISADINGGRGISETKAQWLDEQISTAIKADKKGNKPIFVFGHLPASQTTLGSSDVDGGSGSYDVAALDAVLRKYPQVVYMAGHTHTSSCDPLSIDQNYFTAIGTGTFAYGDYPVYTGDGSTQTYGIQLNTHGDYQNGLSDAYNEHGERESCVFMIMELDAKNRLRIRYYNADAEAFVGDPVIIDSIGDRDAFTFTDDRGENSQIPSFPAELSVKSLSARSLIVNIPNAVCPDYVSNYRVDLMQNGKCLKTVYRLACQNQLPLPIEITASFSDLSPETDYEVVVYAYNAYGKMSEPLTLSVTTKSETNLPDVFQMKIQDGTIVNDLTGETLKKTGSPSAVYDDTINQNVLSFTGSGSYDYEEFGEYYGLLTSGFSFEMVGKVAAVPTNSYVDFVSDQHNGGFGFEFSKDGNVYILTSVMGADRKASYAETGVKLPLGEYFHLTATYDGNILKLYLNGELASEVTAKGSVWFPIKDSARYLAIGGDAALGGKSNNFMTGEIAAVNVYSFALTADTVAEKYEALSIR